MTFKDYDYYLDHQFMKYDGKWIAIVNQKVVASDKSVKKVCNRAKKLYPKRIPFIAKIDKRLRIR
ncbi:DUF5678 domain-containing protein [Nanoarchaeota archaeon]